MTAKRQAPGPRYQALLQLLRTADTIWDASRAFFAPWDLSPSQFNVLNLLHHQAGLSQTELSRELIMHRSNVTGLIDRLEQRGLVQRTEVADRRAYRVVLTPAGTRLMEELLPRYYDGAERLCGDLRHDRLAALMADLQQIAAKAELIAAESKTDLKEKPGRRVRGAGLQRARTL